MISRHIFESSFSLATVQALKIWADGNLIDGNIYIKIFDIPVYNPIEPTHYLVTPSKSLSAITNAINNPSYDHIYVENGDYKALGNIIVTLSGTLVKYRTISLYNGNDTHPGALATANIAQLSLHFTNSDYWVVDRMSMIGGAEGNTKLINSKNVIFNRWFSDLAPYPILIFNGSHDFTLQKSRVQGAANNDAVAINIRGDETEYIDADGDRHYAVLDCHIISNEIVDQNDGFQNTNRQDYGSPTSYQYHNVGGLVVYDNDIYINPTHAYGENGTDSKGGSPDPRPDAAHDNETDNPTIPVTIAGNRIWGYNHDNSLKALNHSFYSNGHKVYDNIIFDSSTGIGGGGNESEAGNRLSQGYVDCEVYNNILYRCGTTQTGNSAYSPFRIWNGRGTSIHDNYIIEAQGDQIATIGDYHTGSDFTDNKVIRPLNSGSWYVHERTDLGNDTAFDASVATTIEVADTGFTDYKFYKDKYTATPTLVTLSNILDPSGNITSPI